MSPKKKSKIRIAANGYRLCDPLPKGEVLIDTNKKQWVLGAAIGSGGFGDIYSCRRQGERQDGYVLKLDNIDGPLFAEMNFYLRVAKDETIKAFADKHKLKFIGMPRYVASGIHDKSSACTNKLNKDVVANSQTKNKRNAPTLQYRFLVMERFGRELSDFVSKRQLSTADASGIGAKMIDVLQYIHSFGYIHADIKGTNILKSLAKNAKGDEFYLVDYGLAERYCQPNGTHRDDKPDKKRANNGTVEYRSRDAHIGLISRRSDIECLAYNVIEWLSGKLPWMSFLSNAAKVEKTKEECMQNVGKFLRQCFRNSVPKGLEEFLEEVNEIDFKSEPNYSGLRKILLEKVAKNKSNLSERHVNESDNEDEEEDEESDESDDESDDEEVVNNNTPKRRQKVLKTRKTKKSPQKRKNNNLNVVKSKSKDISVIELSDSSDEDYKQMVSKSPSKRKRLEAIKSDNNLEQKTPKNKLLPRFSTPLLFEDDESECESSSDRLSRSAGDRKRRPVRRSTNGSITDLELSKGEPTPSAPVETAAMKAMRELIQKKKLEKEMKKKKTIKK